ncbi:PQQ-dependent sugar dehydrogenase [Runella aurantiaca]|uniref:PKD/Chitinase domain-containing protein n=1 Tax=Runella aurantiaca TaxID=2282308 RepID=A0A369IDZ9_9BACT|nr:PQQ-dependent sugar dehydrogenase [Runella aurantiaca]RDB08001.1 hypothetical protein DVG78_02840 [Runella aurantiaca]
MRIALFLCFFAFITTVHSQPSGFQSQLKVKGANGDLVGMVGVVFDQVGQMYTWEKNGKVWAIRFDANGNAQKYLLLDINYEVLSNNDLGLVSVVLHPDFLTNGYLYLMYAVNRTYLLTGMNGNDGSDQTGSIVRITRYKANINAAPSFTALVNNSRVVLLGTTPSDGIPIIWNNHGGGCMVFGEDGTLMISTGDGAFAGVYDRGNEGNYQQAIDAGVITQAHNIGAYRSQVDNSHNGKILRIDPETGNGIPSNPLYNPSTPRAAISRMWAKGLRNPFRMTLVPNSGSHNPEDGDPGVLVVGDVGNFSREEINTVTAPNQNFGWPLYEGLERINTPWNDPNYAPTTHRKPILEYRSLTTDANVYLNQTTKVQIGSAQFPYTGPTFSGASTMGGVFYTGTKYPADYQNALFMADYDGKWIRVLKLNANHDPVSISHFMTASQKIVHLAYNEVDESIYYITGVSESTNPCDEVRKLHYSSSNLPPVAKIETDVNSGLAPLPVAFTALKSYDPEGTSLTYEWRINDAPPFSTGLAPHYLFNPPTNGRQKYKVKLTVRDTNGTGLSSSDSTYIYVNSTPPVINSISLDTISGVSASVDYPLTLSAVVSDGQSPTDSLQLSWTVALVHNGHEHRNPTQVGNAINTVLDGTPCEVGDATYFYRIYLTVTDPDGLSTNYHKDIPVNCAGMPQIISFTDIDDQSISLNTSSNVSLSATTSSGLSPIHFFSSSGPAYIIGNILTLTGAPGQVTVRAVQHGDANYRPAIPVEQTFEVNRSITPYSIQFTSIGTKAASSPPFILSASSSPTNETIEYLLISGPATLSGNTVTLTGQGGTVRIRAFFKGSYSKNGKFVEQTFEVVCPTQYALNSPITNGQSVSLEASESITAVNTIASGATVAYQAGNAVYLNAGFKAEQGSTFQVQIAGCRPITPSATSSQK